MADGSPLVRSHVEQIAKRGYTILEDVIAPERVDAISEALLRLERDEAIRPAANEFEGSATIRIYNLLARARIFEEIPVHEAVLPVVAGVLDRGCLISSLSSISILPGESAQPIHADDQLMPLPRPHPPLVCNTMWALTDFTEANGATRIVPGSHQRPDAPPYGDPSIQSQTVAAEMRRGSVLVWNGSLWHGGGANQTDERRVGIAMNYCAGFIRQQENQQLGIPAETVRGFSKRLRQLVGYGTYHSLIGHIDKRTPEEVILGEPRDFRSVWDRADGES